MHWTVVIHPGGLGLLGNRYNGSFEADFNSALLERTVVDVCEDRRNLVGTVPQGGCGDVWTQGWRQRGACCGAMVYSNYTASCKLITMITITVTSLQKDQLQLHH